MKLECPYLSQFPLIRHAFFEGRPDHFCLETVLSLVTLKQVHGDTVIQVNEPWEGERVGDGLVTSVKGIALGILTADCCPVLFYDPIVEVIGACHAGWRGARGGILQATLNAMEDLGAKRSQIYASLGPTIQQANYEVGPEFPDLIGESYETYFYPAKKEGYHYFNLPGYICRQLLDEGLAQVHDIKRDTFVGLFASRRRFLSQGIEGISFNNLSAIAII